ncbi:hypothetical protein IAT40_001214 [Kwoniella sp. CBS 6097]
MYFPTREFVEDELDFGDGDGDGDGASKNESQDNRDNGTAGTIDLSASSLETKSVQTSACNISEATPIIEPERSAASSKGEDPLTASETDEILRVRRALRSSNSGICWKQYKRTDGASAEVEVECTPCSRMTSKSSCRAILYWTSQDSRELIPTTAARPLVTLCRQVTWTDR